MSRRRNLLRAIRRKLGTSSCRAVDVQSCGPDGEARVDASADDRSALIGDDSGSRGAGGAELVAAAPGEVAAAVKVQAAYRGHLARRALRALRGLVRLQAVVRGFCVRRQVRAAMACMQALVRLQVRVRTRQLHGGAQIMTTAFSG